MSDSTLSMKLDRLNDGVLCNLQIGFWGARSKLDKEMLGDNIPKEIVRAVHDLVDDKSAIDDIRTVQRQIKYIVKTNAIAFPIDSVWFLPKHKIQEVSEQIDERIIQINELTDVLASKFKGMERKFAKKYPQFYDHKKYPRDIKKRFYADYTFFHIGLPESIATELDPKEYNRKIEKFRGMVETMESDMVNLIANKLVNRLDLLASQCSGETTPHGKTISSINRFLAKWNDLWKGHVDEAKLTRIMNMLKKQMKKVDSDRLKGNEDFRNEVGRKVENIISKIEKIPNVELKRKIDI